MIQQQWMVTALVGGVGEGGHTGGWVIGRKGQLNGPSFINVGQIIAFYILFSTINHFSYIE